MPRASAAVRRPTPPPRRAKAALSLPSAQEPLRGPPTQERLQRPSRSPGAEKCPEAGQPPTLFAGAKPKWGDHTTRAQSVPLQPVPKQSASSLSTAGVTAAQSQEEVLEQEADQRAVQEAMDQHRTVLHDLKRRAEEALDAEGDGSEAKRRTVEKLAELTEHAQKLMQMAVDLTRLSGPQETAQEEAAREPAEQAKAAGDGGGRRRKGKEEAGGRGIEGYDLRPWGVSSSQAGPLGQTAKAAPGPAPPQPVQQQAAGSARSPATPPRKPGSASASSQTEPLVPHPPSGPPPEHLRQGAAKAPSAASGRGEQARQQELGDEHAELRAFSTEVRVRHWWTVAQQEKSLLLEICYAAASRRCRGNSMTET